MDPFEIAKFYMSRISSPRLLALTLVLLLAVLTASSALAHQPFFEDPDSTAAAPISVRDPEISTALYSTLDRPDDVDFFSFSVTTGQTIEIGMSIPQIEGQEQFAPSIAVIARGMDMATDQWLPEDAAPLLSDDRGATLIGPVMAQIFFEPFSRTAYWQRQRQRITFAADGEVHVVVWHPQQETGRYTLVVGQREVLGGDPGFARKLREFWTPVVQSPGEGEGEDLAQGRAADTTSKPTAAAPESTDSESSDGDCSWFMRLLATLLGMNDICQ